jgi:hypothetical protein
LKLILEDFRSFQGRHEITVKPITLLVGENSTGKTSLLGAFSTLRHMPVPFVSVLSQSPYDFGPFESFATSAGRKVAKRFTIGYEVDENQNAQDLVVRGVFDNSAGQPRLAQMTFRQGAELDMTITLSAVEPSPILRVEATVLGRTYQEDVPPVKGVYGLVDAMGYLFAMEGLLTRSDRPEEQALIQKLVPRMRSNPWAYRSKSLGPLRANPERTYSTPRSAFTSDGGNVAWTLRNLDAAGTEYDATRTYGFNSGLFTDVIVKKLGTSDSSPIQLMVKRNGRQDNIVDVGYGVAQVLPIIVECARAGDGEWLLLQQPEVHLHPRAQAELSSFFVRMHKQKRQNYIVETHSDFIIDRLRLEVARGAVSADDVSILYFEKEHNSTKVFEIGIDNDGNIVDAPLTYRNFFLQETLSVLGRA